MLCKAFEVKVLFGKIKFLKSCNFST